MEITNKNPAEVNTQSLAYLGDAVLELLVREKLVLDSTSVGRVHPSIKSLGYVTASSQSMAASKIMSHLTEDEISVYKRGRNNTHSNVPKNASPGEYRRATGFECLFGYLYLLGDNERIRELFQLAYESD